MFCSVTSVALQGITGTIIRVEADINDGLPLFHMVGYLSTQVREAAQRVRSAIKNSGYFLPPKHIIVNLSPADIKKEGTAFDLAIAAAILSSLGELPKKFLQQTILIGELSLDGKVNPVKGVLPMVYAAKCAGYTYCLLPVENAKEASIVDEIKIIGVHSLKESVQFLKGEKEIEPEPKRLDILYKSAEKQEELDFCDVIGQENVKRAIEIAVSGRHHLLIIGAPGVGKTLLIKRIPGIMPELNKKECLEISMIYSICGLLGKGQRIITKRPFRAPHHTITQTALTGGSLSLKPGEISLAHKGVLFLDELTEFKSATLEVLRQPIEEKNITISRSSGTVSYPADILLVAAMNPCKCGFYPDRRRCSCRESQVKQYLSKVSQPFLQRIDLIVEAMPIVPNFLNSKKAESSACIRKRILQTQRIQKRRYQEETIEYNGELEEAKIKQFCVLREKEKRQLLESAEQLKFSARTWNKVLKIARTIADMDQKEQIEEIHLSEAIYYTKAVKKFWK